MRNIARIKNVVFALILIAFAVILLTMPQFGPMLILLVLGALMILSGIRSLIYYFTMAKNMVGGKKTLYHSIFIIDVGAFLMAGYSGSEQLILLYLMGLLAISGGIDLIRALESKKEGAPWKLRFISALIAFVLLIASILSMSNKQLVVYIFCIGLLYNAITRIISAFRKTAVIYIPE